MPTYGDTTEPGIITELDSALNVNTTGAAPSNLGMVGQADLANGTAAADTVYKVTRATQARTLFGVEGESLLTQGIIDALYEGAYPVYAAAPARVSVTGEDLSGLSSTSGTLANGPATEDAADTSFTIDGVSKTTIITYEDAHSKAPGTDEVYLNPVTKNFELDAAPADTDSTNDTVDYSYFDYLPAHDAMRDQEGETIDLFVTLNENQAVADDIQTTTSEMENESNLAIGFVAPGDTIIDPANYEPTYDDSRMQVIYGTRFDDNTSLLAAYAGLRASLGLDRTPINLNLRTDKRIAGYQADLLTRNDRGNLNDLTVPLADEADGPRVTADPTTVTSSNTEEQNMDLGFTRLLMDYIVETTRANEQPFIGRLNNPAVRNSFRDLVQAELSALKSSGIVLNYTINVEKVDATTALLEVSVDAAEPIRFIQNKVTVGNSA